MSMDVRITQKGFFKNYLTINAIIGSELCYGKSDPYLRLVPNERDGDEFFVYLPNYPGRGIYVKFDEKNLKNIDLKLLFPSLTEEVRAFFNLIRRLSQLWKCSIEIDGNIIDPKNLDAIEKDTIAFNTNVFDMACKEILDGKMQKWTMPCVCFPIEAGKEEAEKFLGRNDLFQKWILDLQLPDYYYGAPVLRESNKTVVGIFVVTFDTETILPLVPSIPDGTTDTDTGEPVECKKYHVNFYNYRRSSMLPDDIEYNKFLGLIPSEKKARFDEGHILIKLSEDDIKQIIADSKK